MASSATAATLTVDPPSGASGVSRSAQVVFTFSEPMNTEPDVTMFIFIKLGGFTPLPITTVWNPAGTVATISPVPFWPDNSTIFWSVSGETLDTADPVDEFGSFSVGGSSSGGTGTNAVTSFSVMVFHGFVQTNAAAPVIDTNFGYAFQAGTVLASNRTANSVTVQPPGSSPLSLTRSPLTPEQFHFIDTTNDLAGLNAKYPGGGYQFVVSATTSNQQITVTLSDPAQQPSTPHVTNFDAAQAVDAAQAFTLSWEPFVGGTANDAIVVEVGDAFQTPDPPGPGMLNGTATSVVIPANALQPNTNCTGRIYFGRLAFTTNGTSTTSAERITFTEFPVLTTGTNSARPTLSSLAKVLGTNFQFQVQAGAGQTLFVEASQTLVSNSWTTVYTTNASGPLTTITLPMVPPDRRFFRVRTN